MIYEDDMVRSLIALAVVSASVVASAQNKVQMSADGRPSRIAAPKMGLNMRDKMSVMNAAVANLFEIRSSEIALKRGNNAWTKHFAKDMIRDHSGSFEELRLVAKRKGLMVSKTLPAKQSMVLRKLETCPRSQFDAMYRMAQIKGHEETTMALSTGIKYGKDADVRNYLIKTLPIVKAHLKNAMMKKTMTHNM